MMAARDISLASISSKVSDDSLLRLVARIAYWLPCLSSSPHIHGWPAGAATRARRVWYWPAGAAARDEFDPRGLFDRYIIIGASVSEPHTSGYNAAFSLSIVYVVRHL